MTDVGPGIALPIIVEAERLLPPATR